MNYVGDFQPGSNVFIWFNSFTSDDPAASVTMTNFVDTDVHIYKDDSLTQRQNAAGVAVDVDVDTFAGVHKITIDTADNTVADFFEAGHDYAVIIEGTTIDAGTVNACVGTFSIANRRVAGQMCSSSIEAYTDTTNFTLTTGEASADNDAYNGCTIIVTDQVTKIQKAVGHISDYVGATRAIVLHAAPLQTNYTMAVGDSVEIFATAAFANVNTIGQTTQTANDNGTDINAILTDTNELQTDDIPGTLSTIAGYIDTEVTAIKDVTDNLPNSGALTDIDTGVNNLETACITNAAGTDVAADIIAIKAETATIVTDTNELQSDDYPTSIAAVQTTVDAIETAVITNAAGTDVAADIIAVKAETASILTDTGTTIPGTITTAQNDLDTLTGADGVTLATTQANYAPAKAGDLMGLANDAITSAKYDESSAFPVKSADTGATQIARVGADSDTLETLSDQIDGITASTDVESIMGTALTETNAGDLANNISQFYDVNPTTTKEVGDVGGGAATVPPSIGD